MKVNKLILLTTLLIGSQNLYPAAAPVGGDFWNLGENPTSFDFQVARNAIAYLQTSGELQNTVASYKSKIKEVKESLDDYLANLSRLRNSNPSRPYTNDASTPALRAVRHYKAELQILEEGLTQLQK